MNKYIASAFLVVATALSSPSAPCRQLDAEVKSRARALLAEGAQAFKSGDFPRAVEDFKQAKMLDPLLVNARLYLATAYANQYITGAPSEENTRLGEQAIEEFKGVLDMEPSNLAAIDGIGSILYSMAGTPFDPHKMEESKSYHKKHIEIKPTDPEPYYWVGVIDWSVAFRTNKELRAEWSKRTSQQLGDQQLLPEEVRREFSNKCLETVNEGIESMKQAMSLRPNYDDAMAYLSLLYRQKAETEPPGGLREEDIRTADNLVDEVKALKEKKMGQPRLQ
jgi:tetratricopeptide (TPR) repeat protein